MLFPIMNRRSPGRGSAETCERCGRPIRNHHVGDVCVERGDGDGDGANGLPWSLRAVRLAACADDVRRPVRAL